MEHLRERCHAATKVALKSFDELSKLKNGASNYYLLILIEFYCLQGHRKVLVSVSWQNMVFVCVNLVEINEARRALCC